MSLKNIALNEPDVLFKIIPVIIGAILGAVITRYLNRNRERVALSFEMHREFNNSEMSAHRRRAVEVIKKFPFTPVFDLDDEHDPNVISILIVLRFFQRLSSSVKYKQVKKQLVIALFYELFFYWYYVVYKDNLVNKYNWESANQIEFLAQWFIKQKGKEHEIIIQKMLGERTRIVEIYEKQHKAGSPEAFNSKSQPLHRIFNDILRIFKV